MRQQNLFENLLNSLYELESRLRSNDREWLRRHGFSLEDSEDRALRVLQFLREEARRLYFEN